MSAYCCKCLQLPTSKASCCINGTMHCFCAARPSNNNRCENCGVFQIFLKHGPCPAAPTGLHAFWGSNVSLNSAITSNIGNYDKEQEQQILKKKQELMQEADEYLQKQKQQLLQKKQQLMMEAEEFVQTQNEEILQKQQELMQEAEEFVQTQNHLYSNQKQQEESTANALKKIQDEANETSRIIASMEQTATATSTTTENLPSYNLNEFEAMEQVPDETNSEENLQVEYTVNDVEFTEDEANYRQILTSLEQSATAAAETEKIICYTIEVRSFDEYQNQSNSEQSQHEESTENPLHMMEEEEQSTATTQDAKVYILSEFKVLEETHNQPNFEQNQQIEITGNSLNTIENEPNAHQRTTVSLEASTSAVSENNQNSLNTGLNQHVESTENQIQKAEIAQSTAAVSPIEKINVYSITEFRTLHECPRCGLPRNSTKKWISHGQMCGANPLPSLASRPFYFLLNHKRAWCHKLVQQSNWTFHVSSNSKCIVCPHEYLKGTPEPDMPGCPVSVHEKKVPKLTVRNTKRKRNQTQSRRK